MNVASLSHLFAVNTIEELRRALKERSMGRFGTFLLDFQGYPYLLVAFNENQAWLNYFPTEDHPGYLSQSLVPFENTYVDFLDEDSAIEQRPISCVIPSELAEQAVLEFFEKQDLPVCVNWLEL